jgi:molybdenum cofactor synthesis domain-containing protein
MITACVLTMSDKGAAGQRKDESGPLIRNMLGKIDVQVKYTEVIPDDMELIKNKLIECSGKADLVLTTGGTGLAPRDVTPEATLSVVDRQVPGIAEAMRAESLAKTPRGMLSRAVAGVRGRCLIVNLPGSPKAVEENLSVILDVIPHAVAKIKGSKEECAR